MKFYIICLSAILLSCNSREHKIYNKLEIGDIKTHFVVDTQGAIIDTLPSWVKLLRDYSFSSNDTSEILLSDSKTAYKFAKHVLDTTYGKIKMDSEEPFEIALIDNKFWLLTGTLPSGYLGGVAMIIVSKYDGKILYVMHGK